MKNSPVRNRLIQELPLALGEEVPLEVATDSIRALLTQTIKLPACTTLNRQLRRLESVRNYPSLGLVIHETYLFLTGLRKALGVSEFNKILAPAEMRRVQELDHFAFRNALPTLPWAKAYDFTQSGD